jgi:hypothetical protein
VGGRLSGGRVVARDVGGNVPADELLMDVDAELESTVSIREARNESLVVVDTDWEGNAIQSQQVGSAGMQCEKDAHISLGEAWAT